MLAAHMDEVGMIIKDISEEGYLGFRFVGGVDRRVALGKQVFIGPERILGVIGMKAIHLVRPKERKDLCPKVEDLYIDIGAADREEAETLVSLGEYAAFSPECVEFGNGFLKAKALDDRIGCALMVQLLREDCHGLYFCLYRTGGSRHSRGVRRRIFRYSGNRAGIGGDHRCRLCDHSGA